MFLPAGISQLNHDLRVADHQLHSPQLKSSRGNVWPALFQVTTVERRIHTLYIYYSLHQLFCQIVKLLKAVFCFFFSQSGTFFLAQIEGLRTEDVKDCKVCCGSVTVIPIRTTQVCMSFNPFPRQEEWFWTQQNCRFNICCTWQPWQCRGKGKIVI